MIQGKELTADEKAKFIKKLKSTHGNVSRACRAVGISRTAAYDHKKADENFARLWDETIEAVSDEMEREAYRRAVQGTIKPVYYKGEKVGEIREFSDSLLQFMLKGNRPEKFRERFDIDQNIKGHLDISIDREIDSIYGDDDGDK